MRTSIVAKGASLSEVFCFRRDDDEPFAEGVDDEMLGAKADASRDAMSFSDQVFDMLSGNWAGLSTMKTSDSLRRPRCRALFWSSFCRIWPRPSASPGRKYIY